MRWIEITEADNNDIQQFESFINSINPYALDKLRNGIAILRGFNSNEHAIKVSKNELERNTNSYSSMFLSNMASWNSLPKRNNSMICTSSDIIAQANGDIYVIIPIGNTTLGVSQDASFNTSFSYMKTKYHINDLNDFNKKFTLFMTYLHNILHTHTQINMSSTNEYSRLISILKNVDKHLDFKRGIYVKTYRELINNGGQGYSFLGNTSILDNITDMFNPVKNNFSLVDFKNYNISFDENHEVWFSGDSYMLSYNLYKPFFNKLGLDLG